MPRLRARGWRRKYYPTAAAEAFQAAGRRELRNCMCHLRNVSEGDYKIIKDNDIAVSAAMNWHSMDEMGLYFNLSILPDPYWYQSYPIRSFFDNGILMSQSSDTPAHDGVNYPFHNMEVAVTAKNRVSDLLWWPEECVSRYQALQALTYNGAWQFNLEKERGSIAAGKWADFILIDQYVLTCGSDVLRNTKVISTYFEGQKVYSNK